MFEALPVVIPTLREVARGTLRPAEAPAGAEETANARTAAILLDARAPGMPALGALYDELELYLQAANIASLRLHRRGQSAVTQMFDILAGVTLLRSHGCERVILVVAAEGTLPSWQQARAETLASLLDLVRRQHSGTARELISAIADLVKTIRIVADSVAGVATILVPASSTHGARAARAARPSWRPLADAREASPEPGGLPKALVLSLREGADRVSAVSQLYLWCRDLSGATPAATHGAEHAPDGVATIRALDGSVKLAQSRAYDTGFHTALHWLDEQWSVLVANMARQTPHAGAHLLADIARQVQMTEQESRAPARPMPSHVASRTVWHYLDICTRLKWLELCRQAFASVGGLATERGEVAAPIERVD